MSMTGIAGPFMVKKFSATAATDIGKTFDLHVDCRIDGWAPLLVADVLTDHAGSFTINQAAITSDGFAYVSIYQPNNNWKSGTVNVTVLYVKAGMIASEERW